MATSPIYSWPEPDNTDLVKNGALAIRTLGNAIDTTMATMTPKSTYTAKGSIAAATAASTPANLAVGSNTAPLVADSAEASGLRWDSSAWTSYTPTFSAAGVPAAIGNGTITGAYKQRGKTIQGRISFTAGSTTTYGTADLTISTPAGLNPVATGVNGIGSGWIFDTSAGAYYQCTVDNNNGNNFSMRPFTLGGTYATIGTASGTVPMTFATGDTIKFFFSYEVA
jgi:hypothetical protein